MEKYSIQKGQHVPKDRKRFGKLEFVVSILRADTHTHIEPLSSMLCSRNWIEHVLVSFFTLMVPLSFAWFHLTWMGLTWKQIGCSEYFTAGNTIAKRISRQMDENLISETSGLNFDWWCIWEKQPNYRYVPKIIRYFHSMHEDGSGAERGDVKGNIHQIQHGVQYCIWCTDIFNIIQLNFNVDIHPERHGVNVMRIRIRRVPAKKMNMRNTTMTMSSECSDIFYASHIIQNIKKSDFDATCDRYILNNGQLFACIWTETPLSQKNQSNQRNHSMNIHTDIIMVMNRYV